MWKICKRPKLNIVGLGRSLHFGVTFLFLQLEALFLSLKLSDLMPTVLMHGSAGKVSTTIEGKQRIWWYEKNKIKARTEGKERGKKSKEKKEKKAEECYIIWKRTAWHDFIGWRKRTEFNLFLQTLILNFSICLKRFFFGIGPYKTFYFYFYFIGLTKTLKQI